MIKLKTNRNKLLSSQIDSFKVWLNTSALDIRLQKGGITGYFKLAKPFLFFFITHGKEFHGMITHDNNVITTEGII